MSKPFQLVLLLISKIHPFLGYCSLYWGVHAKRELSDCANSLALELLKGDYGQASSKLLVARVQGLDIRNFSTYSRFSGLHCTSFFGIIEVVAGLIEMGCYDIDGGDFSDCTPLAWAAYNGHGEVVKILLEQEEVSLDKPDNSGGTPLVHAALTRQEEVVKILLEREWVNPDKRDSIGKTPLSHAASSGNEGVVKILLELEDVNPHQPGGFLQGPLAIATIFCHGGSLKAAIPSTI